MRADVTPPILFRCDGSPQMGVGHVMRCLALAQAWQDRGGGAVFALSGDIPRLAARIAAERMQVRKLPSLSGDRTEGHQIVKWAREIQAAWIVIDGYHFNADYQKTIKDAGLRLLKIEDHKNEEQSHADVLLNQNLHACEEASYARKNHAKLFLGPRYALLRREFLKGRRLGKETSDRAKKILVTLGGGEPRRVLLDVILALRRVKNKNLEIVVVAGACGSGNQTLRSSVLDLNLSLEWRQNEEDMARLMGWADLAVCAGGSTCWEMAFFGVPMITCVLAENQKDIAESLARVGAAVNMGWHETLRREDLAKTLDRLIPDTRTRGEMCRKGRSLVDGLGAQRVAKTLRDGA